MFSLIIALLLNVYGPEQRVNVLGISHPSAIVRAPTWIYQTKECYDWKMTMYKQELVCQRKIDDEISCREIIVQPGGYLSQTWNKWSFCGQLYCFNNILNNAIMSRMMFRPHFNWHTSLGVMKKLCYSVMRLTTVVMAFFFLDMLSYTSLDNLDDLLCCVLCKCDTVKPWPCHMFSVVFWKTGKKDI